jgi:hypothetical protein
MFLRDLLSSNLLVLLFLNLSKELIIDCLAKNANKIKDANKKTKFEMFKDANIFC